jgi:hypothetical protein
MLTFVVIIQQHPMSIRMTGSRLITIGNVQTSCAVHPDAVANVVSTTIVVLINGQELPLINAAGLAITLNGSHPFPQIVTIAPPYLSAINQPLIGTKITRKKSTTK